jgi:hypothetical protein
VGGVNRSNLALLFLLCLALTPAVFAQKPDWHVTGDPASALFQRSAFLHGYIHGYQEGFHFGDLDVHMGRGARDVARVKPFRDANSGYLEAFGDKKRFHEGFRRGLRAGYQDSTSGREFRAFAQLRSLAADLRDTQDLLSDHFDKGVAAGFENGWEQGRNQPRPIHELDAPKASCSRKSVDGGEDFCDGFARGFQAGLSSGYDSQQTEGAISAAARP